MKARLIQKEFEVFRFEKHQAAELPEWLRTYRILHGADVAETYRHFAVAKLMVPVVGGGHVAAMSGDWMVFDGKVVTVVRTPEFQTKFELIPDPA